MKKILYGLGALFVVVAVAAIAYPFYWNNNLTSTKASLLNKASAKGFITPPLITSGSYKPLPKEDLASPPQVSCTSSPTPQIVIPSLGLVAPVEEGDTPSVLDVAVGHVSSTPWPLQQVGYGIFAAHDVSYFAKIDHLKTGDLILYKNKCQIATFVVTKYLVSSPGQLVPTSNGSGIVLDTCYPTNALFYTNQRYLVVAKYQSLSEEAANGQTYSYHKVSPLNLSASIPLAIPTSSLSLGNNTQAMGQMAFTGSPDLSFEQSDNPMTAEAVALENYFALLYALRSSSPSLWAQLSSSPYPSSLALPSLHSTSPLEVTEEVSNDTLNGVTLSTSINGHDMSITQMNVNGLLKISTVQIS